MVPSMRRGGGKIATCMFKGDFQELITSISCWWGEGGVLFPVWVPLYLLGYDFWKKAHYTPKTVPFVISMMLLKVWLDRSFYIHYAFPLWMLWCLLKCDILQKVSLCSLYSYLFISVSSSMCCPEVWLLEKVVPRSMGFPTWMSAEMYLPVKGIPTFSIFIRFCPWMNILMHNEMYFPVKSLFTLFPLCGFCLIVSYSFLYWDFLGIHTISTISPLFSVWGLWCKSRTGTW